ncbi:MAG: ubiquinone/menaquinone biosynthesis methyltransferase [Caldilineaceae bacterium]|nr:ubiquinone/menaquinone biosynthesis methyltransferase [Caldilineaceae bacterium]
MKKSPNPGAVLPSVDAKPRYVNQMFARIAPTYDLMNRLMTGGLDQRWRRELLALADLPAHGRLLDIGAGTGDIAYQAMKEYPGIRAIASDFTYEMMAAGMGKEPGVDLPFVQADAFSLPYPDNSFDAVVSGFLIRNVVDRVAAFREQLRVTKPGGRVLCLETAPPSNVLLAPLFRLYFFRIVPLIGQVVSGDGAAYAYLPQSTVDFPPARPICALQMEMAGLRNVFYRERLMGAVAIHMGMK